MQEALEYPLDFTFKTLALAPQFTVRDASGKEVAYIKQKLFKLREKVRVFRDESQADLLYEISADRWLDWSASYAFTDREGANHGRVARQGARSLWKAHYDVIDTAGNEAFTIREKSVVTRMLDNMLGEIPVLGLFTGYVFNPEYEIRAADGNLVATFAKRPSAIGRRFRLTSMVGVASEAETQIILSLMMMVLLERSRG